jgi:hypothetical protein
MNNTTQPQALIKERSFGLMILFTLLTHGAYAGFFYENIERDINKMGATVGNVPRVEFLGLVSAIFGFYSYYIVAFVVGVTLDIVMGIAYPEHTGGFVLLAFLASFTSVPLLLINAVYVAVKAKTMRETLMKIAQHYYDEYGYSTGGGIFVWSTNWVLMAIISFVFAVFAPMIHAYRLIQVFNDIAREHNKHIVA